MKTNVYFQIREGANSLATHGTIGEQLSYLAARKYKRMKCLQCNYTPLEIIRQYSVKEKFIQLFIELNFNFTEIRNKVYCIM